MVKVLSSDKGHITRKRWSTNGTIKAIKERELCTLFEESQPYREKLSKFQRVCAVRCSENLRTITSGSSIDCFNGLYSADVVSISLACQRVGRF